MKYARAKLSRLAAATLALACLLSNCPVTPAHASATADAPQQGAAQPPAASASAAANGRLAFSSSRDGNDEIFTANPDGSSPVNLTNNKNVADVSPRWSHDGTRVAFSRSNTIFVMNADGTGQTQLTSGHIDFAPSWSPDGKKVAFDRDVGQGGFGEYRCLRDERRRHSADRHHQRRGAG
jgi:WD40-like Beta Propeller Repeat